MPRNGSGGYALDPSTWNPGVDGVTATTSDWNVKVKADLETAIAGSVAADGQTPMSGPLDMGNNRVTNVLAPNSVTDAATAGEIQSGAWQYLTSVAGTNTITASVTGLTAYAAGQTFRAVIANTNTGAVTLNVNSVGAKAITKNGTNALVAGDLLAGAAVEVVYDGTQFQLVTPSKIGAGAKGYLYGMTLSNNGSDATNDIDIAAGECVDSTGVALMVGGAMTKRLDAAWAAGTGNGGRMSAAAIANTTYHMFAILKDSDGTVDYGFDVSPTAPTMPSGYTYFRRIGSVLRESAALVGFIQEGDVFTRMVQSQDYATANPGTSRGTVTCKVPTGIIVGVRLTAAIFDSTPAASTNMLLTALAQADTSPTSGVGFFDLSIQGQGTPQPIATSTSKEVLSNTSGQIGFRLSNSNADITPFIYTVGWVDLRGRLA